MSVLDLRKLHELHLIDHGILEVKKRAKALDPGREIQGKINKLAEIKETKGKELHSLIGEQKDLELRQRGMDDRIKKITGELYGGKIVNPREVETLEKEITHIKEQRGSHDDRILELMELIPPLQKTVSDAEKGIEVYKKELVEFQKKVMVAKTLIENDFKALSAKRPAAAAAVNPSMLTRYEAIRQKFDGMGMTEVKGNSCVACGMNLPEKLLEAAREGRIVFCEACHRILYVTDGLV